MRIGLDEVAVGANLKGKIGVLMQRLREAGIEGCAAHGSLRLSGKDLRMAGATGLRAGKLAARGCRLRWPEAGIGEVILRGELGVGPRQ